VCCQWRLLCWLDALNHLVLRDRHIRWLCLRHTVQNMELPYVQFPRGYRRPANPAPVSGPGSHSRRTDGKQPVMTGTGNGSYGDEQAMEQIQAGAAMGQAATPPDALWEPAGWRWSA
jgi:hypothetical protein